MTKSTTEVSVLELRKLLYLIKESGNNICLRIRLIGELWQKAHLRISKITEDGVVLLDEETNNTVVIDDLQTIIQFGLDKPFQQYQPHVHYTVKLV